MMMWLREKMCMDSTMQVIIKILVWVFNKEGYSILVNRVVQLEELFWLQNNY